MVGLGCKPNIRCYASLQRIESSEDLFCYVSLAILLKWEWVVSGQKAGQGWEKRGKREWIRAKINVFNYLQTGQQPPEKLQWHF